MSALIFSFGSNLSRAQMRRRCPRSEYAGPATLRGYRLAFMGHSGRWGGAVATVVPDPDACVRGTVHALTAPDLRAMDACEGHPFVYRRRTETVRGRGRAIEVQLYVLEDRPFGLPSSEYYQTVRLGYSQHKFRISDLDDAVMFSGRVAREQAERQRQISLHLDRLERDRSFDLRPLRRPARLVSSMVTPTPEPDDEALLWAGDVPSWRRDEWLGDEPEDFDLRDLETSGIRIDRGQ